jgi:hypothetical protein
MRSRPPHPPRQLLSPSKDHPLTLNDVKVLMRPRDERMRELVNGGAVPAAAPAAHPGT